MTDDMWKRLQEKYGVSDGVVRLARSMFEQRAAVLERPPAGAPAASEGELERLPLGLTALPLAIAGHVSQPGRRYIEVTDEVRQSLSAAEQSAAAFNKAFQATKWKLMNALTQDECDLWTAAWELAQRYSGGRADD